MDAVRLTGVVARPESSAFATPPWEIDGIDAAVVPLASDGTDGDR